MEVGSADVLALSQILGQKNYVEFQLQNQIIWLEVKPKSEIEKRKFLLFEIFRFCCENKMPWYAITLRNFSPVWS